MQESESQESLYSDEDGFNDSAEFLVHSNPDILEEICEYIAHEGDLDSEEMASSRSDLFAVMMTCRAFVEPAVSRLWRSLDSLYPLLKLLPAFVQVDGTYVLRGHISAEDWERFDLYASRVRKFSYARDPPDLDIAMHVYFRLALMRSKPMLPSLRQLFCPSTSQDNFLVSGIFLFLSSSLQRIEIGDISPMEDKLCGTVLHTLSSEGAQLEKIALRGHGLTKDTLGLAAKFQSLRELEVIGMGPSLTMEFLEEIGALPWLVELALDFTDSTLTTVERDLGMKDLKGFMVHAPFRFIQAMMSHISTQHLEAIIFVSPNDALFDKKQFLEEIATRWKDTLLRIAVVHHQAGEEPEELTVDTLSPLIGLPRLTYFRLEGYTMQLDDETIAVFARAWPQLHTLLLPFIGGGQPRPTINALRLLSLLSPKLRNLRIPLDTRDLPPFVSSGSPQEPAHMLHTLTIATADDPWELRTLLHLARHIDYCFPDVDSVLAHENHDEDKWLQVHEMIQMYQAVRQEERGFERERMIREEYDLL
ncbi:hypothetical protein D9613_010806 [Agrocybe pediades]|uniref:F-box domain-containing protein n=1 Tax=Agrocybe pediades TaxID=84607 RepID=A0A8H4QL53_9AGAR|nr:hypothetical protein D9613_010806 [Agrocybe pediades]